MLLGDGQHYHEERNHQGLSGKIILLPATSTSPDRSYTGSASADLSRLSPQGDLKRFIEFLYITGARHAERSEECIHSMANGGPLGGCIIEAGDTSQQLGIHRVAVDQEVL